jgi:redox-sensitive bicupin YhaK (pirin superfamily)
MAVVKAHDARVGRYKDLMSRVEVRRSDERFVTVVEGRTTRHSFSFDRHYDPDNVSMGFLLAHNEDLIEPGYGYPLHTHRDVDIVTWVLAGELHHEDSTGAGGIVVPGVVQRLTAGTGVQHSERNGADSHLHFVQMWVQSGEAGLSPSYEQRDVGNDLEPSGGWFTLASGLQSSTDTAAVRLSNSRAGLHAARLLPGERLVLPEAELLHLFVVRGGVEMESLGELDTGDAVRLFGTGGQGLSSAPTSAPNGAVVLLWEMSPGSR